MAEEVIIELIDIQRAHRRRRQLLLVQKAEKGHNTPPEVITEIEDINNELENIQLKIGNIKKSSSNLRSSTVNIISRRISHVNILIDNWLALFDTVKDDKDEMLKNDIVEHIRFLRERKDKLDNILDSNDYCEDLFLYSRQLLFVYCIKQSKSNILSYSKSIGHDEFMEMLRDARFCLTQAKQGGFQKGLIYFYLASISYELQDDSPEIIYEYCREALDRGFDYPEIQGILFYTCKILASYTNQYCNDAKKYLIKAKKRNRPNTSPPFCPNSYIK